MPVSERGATRWARPSSYSGGGYVSEAWNPYGPPPKNPNRPSEVPPNRGGTNRPKPSLPDLVRQRKYAEARRGFDALRKELQTLARNRPDPATQKLLRRILPWARKLARLHPWLRAAEWFLDFLDFLDEVGFEEIYKPGSLVEFGECPGTTPDYTLQGYMGVVNEQCFAVARPTWFTEPGVQSSPYGFTTLKVLEVVEWEYTGGLKMVRSKRIWDNANWPEPTAPPLLLPAPWFAPNPNQARTMPSVKADVVPDAGQPVPGAEVEPQTQPAPNMQVPTSIGFANSGRFNPTPHVRARPPSGVKENKNISRSKALTIAIFGALDKISEAAEVVDAAYEALPKDVRDRWDRKGQGPIDNFGQYGIDGSNWKLAALFYNADKIDVKKFIENVIKNHLEDKVIGGIQSQMPPQLGNAVEGGEKEFAKHLQNALDLLVKL